MQSGKKNEARSEMKSLNDALRMEVQSAIRELSPRQLEIIRLVAEGNSTKQIALQLDLNEKTVWTYRAKLMRQLTDKIARQVVPRSNIEQRIPSSNRENPIVRPPINAEYVLYLLLRKEEREVVVGDLVECYREMVWRFDKHRADIWFYKQVAGSLWPLLRRALLKIGAFVWLGRLLRRLIS